jgi:hypothetical protein
MKKSSGSDLRNTRRYQVPQIPDAKENLRIMLLGTDNEPTANASFAQARPIGQSFKI